MSNISGTRAVPTGWVGWVVFAGLMMIINGFMNVISGIAAIAKDEVYVAGRHAAVLLDTTAFGWIHLLLGIVVAIAHVAPRITKNPAVATTIPRTRWIQPKAVTSSSTDACRPTT